MWSHRFFAVISDVVCRMTGAGPLFVGPEHPHASAGDGAAFPQQEPVGFIV